MKKINIKKAAVIGVCCTIISTSTVFAVSDNLDINNEIKIQINSEWVQEKFNTFIDKGRTFAEVGELTKKLSAKTETDLETGVIKIYTGNIEIEFEIGRKSVKIKKNDGGELTEETVSLEAAPRTVEEKIYIPLRFIAESLGYNVQWDNSLRAVIIETDDMAAVERPVEFEIAEKQSIDKNELLLEFYNKNYMTRGIYYVTDKDYMYVLVSAGEKPTGGYSLDIESVTEVTPGTVYVHAVLHSPEEGSVVTQVLTYPNQMLKFKKEGIEDVQWDLSGDIQSDEAEKNEVIKFVRNFGGQLKMVSLMEPKDILKETMNEYYGEYVSVELIEKWLEDPADAPGRLTSSPWPYRIDILSVKKTSDNKYIVNGNVVELTGVEMIDRGIAVKREIFLEIDKIGGKWIVVDAELGDYENEKDNIEIYMNEEYGFSFELPESWKGYTIQNDIWKGTSLIDEGKEVTGPMIYIRHPKWSEENKRQDIPVMIFTTDQWKALQNSDFSVGAAPVAPSKLGENSKYVLALPGRYNYEFLTGYEEIEQILETNPVKTFRAE